MPTRIKYLEKQILQKRLSIEQAPNNLKNQLYEELQNLEFEYELRKKIVIDKNLSNPSYPGFL